LVIFKCLGEDRRGCIGGHKRFKISRQSDRLLAETDSLKDYFFLKSNYYMFLQRLRTPLLQTLVFSEYAFTSHVFFCG
jgi:hypothetical protein